MENQIALQFVNISKAFGHKVANKNVSLELRKGEILAVLGENGSGKTSLMNTAVGIYYPDEGQIFVNGEEASIHSPADAYNYHIGMIHQHFKLVDIFTAKENVILGLTKEDYKKQEDATREKEDAKLAKIKEEGREPTKEELKKYNKRIKDSKSYNLEEAKRRIIKICKKYGFEVDPDKKVYEMSVSEKQTLEIVKALYKGVDILILDEPTAVLTPQETKKLFNVLRNMSAQGKSIIIITHKLNEVLEISDRVDILRAGEFIGSLKTSETGVQEMTDMMVGHAVELNIDRPEPKNVEPRLEISGLTVRSEEGILKLDNVSFTANSGEILGIAGISNSGQKELLEAIAGLQPVESGDIFYLSEDGKKTSLIGKDPLDIQRLGVSLSFVPEDRLGMGLVGNMDLTDNMMLRSFRKGRGLFVDRGKPKGVATDVVNKLEVVTPNLATPVRRLSGGNVQKVLVGREIALAPSVLLTAYAVRGLDINSSYAIYDLMNQQKEKGVAVIYVGEDLDVLLELADRILILCGGKVSGIVDGRKTDKYEVGLMMTSLGGGEAR